MTRTLPRPGDIATLTRRAWQYLRVSDDKDGRSTSTDDQSTENFAAAEHDLAAVVFRTYRDDDRSASRYATREREEFLRVMTDLESGDLDDTVGLLWEVNRMARRAGKMAQFLDLCIDHRVTLWVTNHHREYDPAKSRDYRSLMEDAVDAEYDSGKISDNTRRGLRSRAAAGAPHSRCPYGYERIYDAANARGRRFVEQRPKEPEASVVRAMYKRVIAGDALNKIAIDLNEAGTPSPLGGTWKQSDIGKMLRNQAYIGKRTHRVNRTGPVEVTNAVWPGLVDDATFYAVLRILTDPRRRTTMRPGRLIHVLSGILRCGVCGSTMGVNAGGAARKRKGIGPAYACRSRRSCTTIDQAKAEHLVEDALLGYLGRPGVRDRLLAGDGADATLVAARAEIARLDIELKEVYGNVTLSAAVMQAQENRITSLRSAAEERLEAAAVPVSLRGLVRGPSEELRARWEAMSVSAKRDSIDDVFGLSVNPRAKGAMQTHERLVITPKR